jgi:hypothetical protein
MERKRFLLRLSPELHETLERWAADELRSVNGQIEFLLQEAVRRAGRGGKKGTGPNGP